MARESYRLTELLAGFPEDEVLDVTARFGEWHMYDLELEPRRGPLPNARKVVVSKETAGFSEGAILDETARIGDWHEYDLAFEPGKRNSDPSGDVVKITMEDLEKVADPVDASA